ncbi:MAG: helix-turn-helix domain-containing protein [Candidatus Izemoplasma sp.]|nr:helix-turn-helix domain-containing protein [Candidatus Izemoplasma sp.]
MENKLRIIKTDEELKIFTDPYRMKIIETFRESDSPMTVKQVADSLGEVPAKVHYHVKKLLKIELIELDHIEIINGINAKYYRMPYNEFRVELPSGTQLNKRRQLNYISKMISEILEEFKDDVYARQDHLINNETNTEDEGTLHQNSLYLNEKELVKFTKEYTELVEKYRENQEKKEGLNHYNTIMGIIKKTKK